MTKILLFISALILAGATAQAQAVYSGKKIYILPQGQQNAIPDQGSLATALKSAERIEVTPVTQTNVQVEKCGAGGCQDVLGKSVSVSDFATASQKLGAAVLQDCRVCAPMEALQVTPSDLSTHTLQLQQELGQ